MDWVALHCAVDDFCKAYEAVAHERAIGDGTRRRKRAGRLSLAEMLTIVIGFHGSGFRTFKGYYLWLSTERRGEFPH